MSRDRLVLGEFGETLACEELVRRGYAILARRYRQRRGEIDIVAIDGGTVVFVEVKTRAGNSFGSGAEAVTRTKRQRLARIAHEFVVREGLTTHPCRFDVVAIAIGAGAPRLEVYTNAFDAAGAV